MTFAGYETDRAAFFGRGANAARSRSRWQPPDGRSGAGSGAVLDPIMSLMASVELKPKRTVTLAFVTSVARTRERRARARAAVRLDARGSLGLPGRRAGERAAPRASAARARAACRPFSGSSPRSSSPIRPCARLPDAIAAGAPVQASPLGARDLRRRSDPARARARPAGAAPARGHRRAALPAIVRRPPRPRPRRRAGVRVRHRRRRERCGASSPQSDVDEWLNRHGGVFVLAADQLQGDERRHLEASARVVLDTRDGSLAARMGEPPESPPKLPRFEPTLADDGVAACAAAPEAALRQRHRRLHRGRARVRDLACGPASPTPAPWCNVLANPELRLPRQRVVARLDLVAQRGREPAHALEKRPGLRYARRGPVPAGRRDRGGLVADAAARGGRRRDARAPRRRLHDLRAREPWPRARAHGLRSRRRAAQGGAAPAQEHARAAPAADRDLLCRVGPGQPARGAATVHRERVRSRRTPASWRRATGTPSSATASRSSPPSARRTGSRPTASEFLGRRGDYARPEALERWGLAGERRRRRRPVRRPAGAPRARSWRGASRRTSSSARPPIATRRSSAWRASETPRSSSPRGRSCTRSGTACSGACASRRRSRRWTSCSTDGCSTRRSRRASSGARPSTSRAARSGIATSCRTSWRSFTGRPSARARTSSKRPGTSSRRATCCTGGIRPSGRGVRTRCSDDMAWLPFVTAEYVLATGDTSILSERVAVLDRASRLRADEHDRYAEFASSAARRIPLRALPPGARARGDRRAVTACRSWATATGTTG